jgi:prepilin-type N-terminal cleavage/methylation domain-containing protein
MSGRLTDKSGMIQPRTFARGRNGRAGFTLVELALAAAVLAILLFVLVGAAAYVRNQGMAQFTRDVLARTGRALADYHQRTGQFPPDRLAAIGVNPMSGHRPETEGAECLVRTMLAAAPEGEPPFWKTGGAYARALANADGDQDATEFRPLDELVDGWGRPLLYYHGYGAGNSESGLPLPRFTSVGERAMNRLNDSLSRRWVQNGRRPLLDSAGPDGQFDNSDDVRLVRDARSGETDDNATSQP